MKKVVRFFAIVIAMVISSNLLAQTFKIDGITYRVNGSNTVAVNSCDTSLKGSIVIPATVTYNDSSYTVEGIDGAAFLGMENIVSITLPNTIEIINILAFAGSGIKSFVMPNSVKWIGGGCFYNCSELKSVTLSENIKALLKTQLVKDGEVKQLFGFFEGCTSLTSVTIPDSVMYIDTLTFEGCSSLKSVEIGTGMKGIFAGAFWNCTSLTNINLPDGLLYIDSRAFQLCKSLKEITIPNTVEQLGDIVFLECESLESVTLSNKLEKIPYGCFAACESLKSIEFPDNINTIEDSAFWYCTHLKTVTIGKDMDDIGDGAFRDCERLETINSNAKIAPTAKKTSFKGIDEDCVVNVPCGSKTSYEQANGWSDFKIVEDCGQSGIEDVADINTIAVYPNPAKDFITLDLGDLTLDINKEITIFNSNGQVVYQSTIQSQKSNIDISSLSSGVYYIKVGNITEKLVVE